MTIITLTTEERHRFAAYLEQEAKTSEDMIAQLDKLGLADDSMKIKLNVEVMAEQIVAIKLRSYESQSIKG